MMNEEGDQDILGGGTMTNNGWGSFLLSPTIGAALDTTTATTNDVFGAAATAALMTHQQTTDPAAAAAMMMMATTTTAIEESPLHDIDDEGMMTMMSMQIIPANNNYPFTNNQTQQPTTTAAVPLTQQSQSQPPPTRKRKTRPTTTGEGGSDSSEAGKTPQQQPTTKTTAGGGGTAAPRKKLWKCCFPGCTEPAKTHYNCHSHVWDAHVRHQLEGANNPISAIVYKKLPDRAAVKTLCRKYMIELEDIQQLNTTTTQTKKKKTTQQTSTPTTGIITHQQSGSSIESTSPTITPKTTTSQQQSPLTTTNTNTATPSPTITSKQPSPITLQPPQYQQATKATATAGGGGSSSDELSSGSSTQQQPQKHNKIKGESDEEYYGDIETKNNGNISSSTASPTNNAQQQQQQQPMTTNTSSPPQQTAMTIQTMPIRIETPQYILPPSNDVVKVIQINPSLARLHVCGEVFAENGFLQRSDARFKDDIAPIRGALDRVLRLAGRTFKYKGEGPSAQPRMGFIAQELEAVVPTAVHRDEKGLSVDVVSLIPLILEALKELHSKTTSSPSTTSSSSSTTTTATMVQQQEQTQIKQLNLAVAEAMARVNELDKKLDTYRDNNNEQQEQSPTTTTWDSIHNNNNSDDDDDDDDDDDNDDEEKGSGGPLTGAKKNKSKRTKKTAEPFRYRFAFGPPFFVLLFGLIMVGAGFVLWQVLPKVPFLWCYCWCSGVIMLLSLIAQRREILEIFQDGLEKLRFYWQTTNSINVYCLVVLFLAGATLTTVMGWASFSAVIVFGIVLLCLWVFCVVAHKRLRVRVATLMVCMVGVLVVSGMCFTILSMMQPFDCSLVSPIGSSYVVNVELNVDVSAHHIRDIPWNCFYVSTKTEPSSLPGNLSFSESSSSKPPPTLQGRVGDLFQTYSVDVHLVCNGYQSFYCGSLELRTCNTRLTQFDCETNLCVWVSHQSNGSSSGSCEFPSALYATAPLAAATSSVVAAAAASSVSLVIVVLFLLL